MIPVRDLHLDLENSRIGTARDEVSAADLLWEEAERTICGLGSHIAEHGLGPGEQWYVIPRVEGGYTVLEGNRRLLALRSLYDPAGISAVAAEARETFPKFLRPSTVLPEEVKCCVFPDRETADMWIDLKHSGPGDGEGMVPWSSKAKYNRRVRQGRPREWGPETWLWLRRTFLQRDLHRRIVDAQRMQYTFMDRMAKTKAFKDTFHLTMGPKGLECGYQPQEVRRAVIKLIDDILDKELSAHKAYTADQITSYIIGTLEPLIETGLFPVPTAAEEPPGTTRPNRDDAAPGRASTSAPSADYEHRDSDTGPARSDALGPAPVTPPSSGVTSDRLFTGVAFDQFGDKVNALGQQAKKIAINTNAETCGVLCRVVIDLACTEFLKRHKMNRRQGKHDELIWQRIVKSLEILDPAVGDAQKCKDPRLHDAWKQSNQGTQGLAVRHMNDFVHATLRRNAPSEVHHLNGLYTPMLVAMEANLRQTPNVVATGQKN